MSPWQTNNSEVYKIPAGKDVQALSKNSYKGRRKNHVLPLKITLSMEKIIGNGETEFHQLQLRKSSLETPFHIILKVLAFFYHWGKRDELVVEPDFRFRGFKPDIIAYKESEIPGESVRTVNTWIECKSVKIAKLQKLGRYLPNSDLYWFHEYNYLNLRLKKQLIKRTSRLPDNLQVIGVKIEENLLNELKMSLYAKKSSWTFSKSGSTSVQVQSSEYTGPLEYVRIFP